MEKWAYTGSLLVYMAISRTKKENIVQNLEDILKQAKTVVFVSFRGILVDEITAMRHSLANEEVGYLVTKKTLLKRAFEDIYKGEKLPELDGEIAIAYGDDIVAPARLIREAGEQIDGQLHIVGGIFEGQIVSSEKMNDIAHVPSLQTLYAQLVMVLHAPIRKCVVALGQIANTKNN